MIKTALILAAGRGARLAPLTNHIPKALCTVTSEPLLMHHLRHLAAAGIERVLLNHAWLGGQIRQQFGTHQLGMRISYLAEPPGALETGGAVVQALPHIGETPFLVVNADIYTDYDFGGLCHEFNQQAHLVLVKSDPRAKHSDDFSIDHHGRLQNQPRNLTFAGIAAYHPDFFTSLTFGRYSLIPFIRAQAEEAHVHASQHHGLWYDTGNPERLAQAREAAKTFSNHTQPLSPRALFS